MLELFFYRMNLPTPNEKISIYSMEMFNTLFICQNYIANLT